MYVLLTISIGGCLCAGLTGRAAKIAKVVNSNLTNLPNRNHGHEQKVEPPVKCMSQSFQKYFCNVINPVLP